MNENSMKITDCRMTANWNEVASWYELKAKAEQRKAFVTVWTIMLFAFITGPALLTMIVYDIIDTTDGQLRPTVLLVAIVTQGLAIIALALALTGNAYKSGKLWSLLRKTGNMRDIITYLSDLGEDRAWIRIAYLMLNQQYVGAYLTDEDGLIVIYDEDGIRKQYVTWDFEVTKLNTSTELVLCVDAGHILLTDPAMLNGTAMCLAYAER